MRGGRLVGTRKVGKKAASHSFEESVFINVDTNITLSFWPLSMDRKLSQFRLFVSVWEFHKAELEFFDVRTMGCYSSNSATSSRRSARRVSSDKSNSTQGPRYMFKAACIVPGRWLADSPVLWCLHHQRRLE